ncbi:Uncharacterised protein [Atlantibacter hermannii]|nr:Uncharacterised protein [Atlantibacter hermannii]
MVTSGGGSHQHGTRDTLALLLFIKGDAALFTRDGIHEKPGVNLQCQHLPDGESSRIRGGFAINFAGKHGQQVCLIRAPCVTSSRYLMPNHNGKINE